MNQAPPSSRFSPPWLLLIGLAAGAAFLVFMMTGDPPGGKRNTSPSKHVIELTEANWQKEVVDSSTPVLVDFWADWCGPCIQLAPTIDKLADQYAGTLKVGKVEIDKQQKLAKKYEVNRYPCVMLFNGDEVPSEVIIGKKIEAEYVRAIEAVLSKR